MKRMQRLITLLLLCVMLFISGASADFSFSDDRFRDSLTTENLDAIIDEYELCLRQDRDRLDTVLCNCHPVLDSLPDADRD